MSFSKKTCFILAMMVCLLAWGIKDSSIPDSSIISASIPAMNIVSGIKEKWERVCSYFRGIDYYINENQALRSEIKRLSALEPSYADYKSQIRRLNQLLELKGDYEESNFNSVSANVISFDFNNWGTAFKIDRGAKDKIKKGCFVVSGDALVGEVIDAGEEYSIVSTVTNPLCSFTVRMRRNNLLGMVSGNVKHKCTLKVYNGFDDVNVGDVVETTEYGGILVGQVAEICSDNGEVSFDIKPAVEFSELKEVLVLYEN